MTYKTANTKYRYDY